MAEYLKKISGQIADFIRSLSFARKLAMVGTFGAIIVGICGIFIWASSTSYRTLMTNLSPEDSNNIARILREKHIPFRVDQNGKEISIPPESVDEFRLELATMGLPQTSVVGYEVFDKQSLGTTSFVQKINQKRALEGELVRTIDTIRGVRHSRVHLALPQKTAFVEDQKKSSASVVLDLDPGVVLDDKQVYGIGNLVAKAVEGMDIADVAIVDSSGKTLSKNNSDPLAAATASQLDYQEKVESEIESRIEHILSRVVGEGHVVAKVSADLDFAQVAETQTTYDQDGAAILSSEKRSDSANATRPGPYGAAGAASNTPGQSPAANGDVKTDTTKNNEVVNYEVPQTIRKTSHPVGSIRKLSVAVLVDGKQVKVAGKDGKVEAKVESWPADKIKEFEDLVSSAAGIDRKRGDILEIKNMEFTREDFDEATRMMSEHEHKVYLQNVIVYGLITLVIGMFFFFVVRPFIKWVTENTIDSVDTFLPQTIEELERMQKNAALPGLEETVPVLPDRLDPEKVEGEMIKEKITTLVDGNPHKAALILKDWLHAPPAQKGGKEEGAGKSKPASA